MTTQAGAEGPCLRLFSFDSRIPWWGHTAQDGIPLDQKSSMFASILTGLTILLALHTNPWIHECLSKEKGMFTNFLSPQHLSQRTALHHPGESRVLYQMWQHRLCLQFSHHHSEPISPKDLRFHASTLLTSTVRKSRPERGTTLAKSHSRCWFAATSPGLVFFSKRIAWITGMIQQLVNGWLLLISTPPGHTPTPGEETNTGRDPPLPRHPGLRPPPGLWPLRLRYRLFHPSFGSLLSSLSIAVRFGEIINVLLTLKSISHPKPLQECRLMHPTLLMGTP